MSLCLVFGSEGLEEVFELAHGVVRRGSNDWLRTLSARRCDGMVYDDREEEFAELKPGLESGELASIQLAQTSPARILLGLYAPHFCGGMLGEWLCILEGEGLDVEEWFGRCRRDGRIGFVAVCDDDSPEFDVRRVTVETFPWDDWRVRRAAVRQDDGTWEERGRGRP